MSNSSQQCPSSWNLITSPVRGCVPSTADATCDCHIPNKRSVLHACVEESMLTSKDHPTPFISMLVLTVWRKTTWMVSPSRMELQAHASTSGLSLLRSMKLITTTMGLEIVLAPTRSLTGPIKYLLSLVAIRTFVILATLDLDLTPPHCTQMILYGMVQGVALLMPAVSSTAPHGFAKRSQNPQQTISS